MTYLPNTDDWFMIVGKTAFDHPDCGVASASTPIAPVLDFCIAKLADGGRGKD